VSPSFRFSRPSGNHPRPSTQSPCQGEETRVLAKMGGDGLRFSNRYWEEDGMVVEKVVEEAQVETRFGAYLPR
jgi:hypothetical protein